MYIKIKGDIIMKNFIDSVYRNIGKKLMFLAFFLNVILLVGGMIAFFVLICDGYDKNNWIGTICFFGGILSFVPSWFIYAYGQKTDDIHAIRNHILKDNNNEVETQNGDDEEYDGQMKNEMEIEDIDSHAESQEDNQPQEQSETFAQYYIRKLKEEKKKSNGITEDIDSDAENLIFTYKSEKTDNEIPSSQQYINKRNTMLIIAIFIVAILLFVIFIKK